MLEIIGTVALVILGIATQCLVGIYFLAKLRT